MGGLLAKLIIDKTHGITYRIKFRGKKCYLQAMITIDRDSNNYQTRSTYGTIGLDYNDGFIEMAETNETGNLVKLKHIDLKYHGTGKKAESEIRQVVSDIVNYAISVGKDIVIEDLDFKKTKAETEKANSDRRKAYNKIIHITFTLLLNNQSGIYDTINQTFNCHGNVFAVQRRFESLQKIYYIFYGV